ncbi:unnamed protein product [Urochloa humidicola]
MDTVISAVVSDFISRFISFVVEKYQQADQVAALKISRLQRLLLRASIVVEEAERRQITNHGMLLQLKQLRESMYRGYYMLDTLGVRLPRPNNGGVEIQDKVYDARRHGQPKNCRRCAYFKACEIWRDV